MPNCISYTSSSSKLPAKGQVSRKSISNASRDDDETASVASNTSIESRGSSVREREHCISNFEGQDEIHAQVSRLSAENEELKSELERSKDKLKMVRAELDKEKTRGGGAKTESNVELEQMKTQLASMERSLEQTKNEFASTKELLMKEQLNSADKSSELNSLQSKLATALDEARHLTTVSAEAGQKALENFEEERGKLKEKVSELEDMVELIALEKEEVGLAKEMAEERVAEMEAQLSEMEAIEAELADAGNESANRTKLAQENLKLKKALRQLHEKSQAKEQELEMELNELREKGRTFDEMSAAKTDLETQVMELEAERDDLKEQIDASSAMEEMVSHLTNQNEALESKSNDLEQSVHHLEEQISVMEEMEEHLSSALEDMTKEKIAREVQLQNVSNSLSDELATIQSRDNMLSRFREELEKKKGEILGLTDRVTAFENERTYIKLPSALQEYRSKLEQEMAALTIQNDVARIDRNDSQALSLCLKNLLPSNMYDKEFVFIQALLILQRISGKSDIVLNQVLTQSANAISFLEASSSSKIVVDGEDGFQSPSNTAGSSDMCTALLNVCSFATCFAYIKRETGNAHSVLQCAHLSESDYLSLSDGVSKQWLEAETLLDDLLRDQNLIETKLTMSSLSSMMNMKKRALVSLTQWQKSSVRKIVDKHMSILQVAQAQPTTRRQIRVESEFASTAVFVNAIGMYAGYKLARVGSDTLEVETPSVTENVVISFFNQSKSIFCKMRALDFGTSDVTESDTIFHFKEAHSSNDEVRCLFVLLQRLQPNAVEGLSSIFKEMSVVDLDSFYTTDLLDLKDSSKRILATIETCISGMKAGVADLSLKIGECARLEEIFEDDFILEVGQIVQAEQNLVDSDSVLSPMQRRSKAFKAQLGEVDRFKEESNLLQSKLEEAKKHISHIQMQIGEGEIERNTLQKKLEESLELVADEGRTKKIAGDSFKMKQTEYKLKKTERENEGLKKERDNLTKKMSELKKQLENGEGVADQSQKKQINPDELRCSGRLVGKLMEEIGMLKRKNFVSEFASPDLAPLRICRSGPITSKLSATKISNGNIEILPSQNCEAYLSPCSPDELFKSCIFVSQFFHCCNIWAMLLMFCYSCFVCTKVFQEQSLGNECGRQASQLKRRIQRERASVKIVDLSDPKVGAYQQLVEQRARIKHLEKDVKGLWSMVGLSQTVDCSSLAQRAQGESIPLREFRYSGILDSHRDSSYFL